jgi:hypothetical protein
VIERPIRRLWFGGLWLFLPWPLLIFSDALVPAVRYLLLGSVAASVAIAEGASGPVGMLVVLFLGMAALTTLGCWLLACLAAMLLGPLPLRTQRTISWFCLAVALAASLVWEPYRTPFGRALAGGLLDVLS